jgi:hypothetical protein
MDLSSSTLYKAGIYLELHRFKNTRRKRNDPCWNLSLAELRALSAVTFLLDQSRYKGNQEPHEIESTHWKHLKTTPVLSFSWNQYLEAYFGPKCPGHQGQQVQLAKQALESLCSKETMNIRYSRKEDSSFIHWIGSILYNASRNPALRSNRKEITLVYHPMFIDRVWTFNVPKPANLFQDIQNYIGKKRIKKPILLFIEWLLTKNNNPTPFEKKTLVERLWLENLLQSRHKARLQAVLQECFDTAKGMGYLLDDAREEGGKLILNLNPEKCKRLKVNPPK